MKAFPRYLDQVARANGLIQEDIAWLFYPGMLQDSPDKWWADFGRRHARHEGVDICFFRINGRMTALPPGAGVPAMFDGTLVNVADDLLGQSLVISYTPPALQPPGFNPSERKGENIVMVYSHLDVDRDLIPGTRISRDRIIGRTFDTRTIRSKLLSHIHLSCMIIPENTPAKALDWSLFPDRKQVEYINPVFL